MAAKSADIRPKITLACTECKERTYITNDHWYRVQDPWWAAVDAVTAWRFEPATLNGKPVDVYFTITVQFKLE